MVCQEREPTFLSLLIVISEIRGSGGPPACHRVRRPAARKNRPNAILALFLFRRAFSAGRDARLYGRPEARRYRIVHIACSSPNSYQHPTVAADTDSELVVEPAQILLTP